MASAMSAVDSAEWRSQRAKLGAHSMHAANDSREVSAPARAAFRRKFEDQVDPERVLTPAERVRRANHAFKAHMTRLSLKSAKVRAARKAAK
jgi:hypothetical protein